MEERFSAPVVLDSKLILLKLILLVQEVCVCICAWKGASKEALKESSFSLLTEKLDHLVAALKGVHLEKHRQAIIYSIS